MIILVAETWPQEAPQVIKKRGNSWWVVVYAGRDPLTGKKRQKTGTART
jgi:Arm DNA-binding domain